MTKEFIDFYINNYQKILSNIVYSYPKMQDPEDVLQDTFIKFFDRYYHKWDPTKSELYTYFYNYVKMCCLSKLKYQLTFISLDAEYEFGDNRTLSLKDLLIQDETVNTIEERLVILDSIVNKLNKRQLMQYNILLLFNNGMTLENIANQEGLDIQTVKNYMHSIRKHFAKQYGKITGLPFEYIKRCQKDNFASNKNNGYHYKKVK